MAISVARKIAYEILRRVESEGAYASDLLHAELGANVKPEDAALATEIVLGVLRWRRQLDFLLERHMKKPVTKLDLPVAGFDVSSEVLDAIKSGKIIATVDQQPYSQGFYAVTELALEIKYGLFPSDMKTGGDGLVDKTNYEPAVKFAGKYR